MSELSIEVTDVTVTHDVIEATTELVAVQTPAPASIVISSAGTAGPQGSIGPAGPAGTNGTNGTNGADSTVPGPATPVDYEGTGFPEGAQTAIVGKTYRDNAATNGAILWVKATGTGNTGWKVAYGDTGWRNITANIVNASNVAIASSGMLIIKRVNDTIYTGIGTGQNIQLNATGDRVLVPTGFEPDKPVWWQWMRWDAASAYALNYEPDAVNGNRFRAASGPMNPFATSTWRPIPFGSWITNAAWPSTLPGSAA